MSLHRQRPLLPTRPKAREVAPLIAAIYDMPDGGAGHCLHIVVEDGNLEDSHVAWAVAFAVHNSCYICTRAGNALTLMSKTQRRKAIRLARD